MINSKLLNINDLTVSFVDKKILDKLSININYGEVHVIMGPNGVGKSTLANVLTGNFTNYTISGSINFDGLDLLKLSIEDIALSGIFLSFQNPVEIHGLSNLNFFKAFINAHRKNKNLNPIESNDFNNLINYYTEKLLFKKDLLNRSVNDGFSGGEKKRNEILQMLLLNPKLIILDEIDSGLDIDSLKLVFKTLEEFKNDKNSILIITHYSRILNYIDVDFVHILNKGKIIESGKKDLAYNVEKYGYSFFKEKK